MFDGREPSPHGRGRPRTQMTASLDPAFETALEQLRTGLVGTGVDWALTGSTSFALQGVPVEPADIDVQTTAAGAYAIADRFSEHIVRPVAYSESETIRSHFGALELNGVPVEVMGAVQKRREDGTWEPPVDITAHREVVDVRGCRLPVLSLAYEARAYERLGRTDRAALLREHA